MSCCAFSLAPFRMSEIPGILEGEELDAELRRPLPVETPYDRMCSKPHMLLYYCAFAGRMAANIWLNAAALKAATQCVAFLLCFLCFLFDSCLHAI